MKTIDVLGKACPIPVIEAKKALAEQDTDGVLVKVDNIVAVQNLEKMAGGSGYEFSYTESAEDSYEVIIKKGGKLPETAKALPTTGTFTGGTVPGGFAVVISSDTMGRGADDLGKILIKGFIYSLTELPVPPKHVIFLNAGARLTFAGANTVDDLKKLEEKGTEILTCGTCANYYGFKDKPAVGAITDMYGITERMTSAGNIINI